MAEALSVFLIMRFARQSPIQDFRSGLALAEILAQTFEFWAGAMRQVIVHIQTGCPQTFLLVGPPSVETSRLDHHLHALPDAIKAFLFLEVAGEVARELTATFDEVRQVAVKQPPETWFPDHGRRGH